MYKYAEAVVLSEWRGIPISGYNNFVLINNYKELGPAFQYFSQAQIVAEALNTAYQAGIDEQIHRTNEMILENS